MITSIAFFVAGIWIVVSSVKDKEKYGDKAKILKYMGIGFVLLGIISLFW